MRGKVHPIAGRFQLAVLIAGLLLGAAFPGSARGQADKASSAPQGKVILLGFDGVDFRTASRFIDQGKLPHLAKLREEGTMSPLQTTNPAQSPVSWASVVTGTNPGKTNIGGFIRHTFQGDMILPALATTEDSYQGEKHEVPYSRFSWLNQETRPKWIALLAAGAFLLALIVLKMLLRLRLVFSLVGALVVGGAAIFFGISFFNELPENVPFPYNLQQGQPFWDLLSQKDIKTVALYAPGAYPVVASADANVLGGLGTPDVTGSTGTWYVYSSEAFTFFDMDTNTGGKVIRLNEEGDGRLFGKIYGPENFYSMERFKKQIDALRERKDDPKMTANERTQAEDAFQEKEDEFESWKSDQKKVTLSFFGTPDYEKHTLRCELEGQTQVVKEGDWSNWFKLDFKLSPFVKIPALLRMRLVKCADGEVRFFVPALDISPQSPPDFIRLTSPPNYASQLAKEMGGPFETVGWSCITHGLKDEELSEEVFLEDIEFTFNSRKRLMDDQLPRKDWDMFFEVYYSPDRVQHMMYRLSDPNHPLYNPQQAERVASFFGGKIALKDAIQESYRSMDRVVGEVMERIDKGEFGPNVVLMVVSDHGFAPFYYCVGVNNFLIEKNFQVLKPNASGEPQTVQALMQSGRDPSMLSFVDFSKSKAYSLGLGKIYINLAGREPEGIVDPADYDAVRDDIIRELEAYKDPRTGERVIKKAYKREEIFSGDFWKEGDAPYQFYGPDGEKISQTRHTEGFADIYLGFMPKYRVSWGTSLGGLEEETIVPNKQKWSGDHVSVDPSEVRGVFFSNRKMRGTHDPAVIDIAPTVLNLFGVKVPEKMDGIPILLEKSGAK